MGRGGLLRRVEDGAAGQRQPGHGLGGHVRNECGLPAQAAERGRRWHRGGRPWWRVAVRQRWDLRQLQRGQPGVGLCDCRGGRVAAWPDERRDAPRLRPPHEPAAAIPAAIAAIAAIAAAAIAAAIFLQSWVA
eukprot:scaffold94307_cov54-Phaeocystis_antarctica.AAC.1